MERLYKILIGALFTIALTACGGGDAPPTPSAPSALTYTTNPAIYTVNEAITNNMPSSSGGIVTSYSVNSALPAGLSLDTGTVVISGTPAVTVASMDYMVTASNSGGSADVTLTLTVNENTQSLLTAGDFHTCAAINGAAQCWGSNISGQLGDGTMTSSTTPVSVEGLSSGVTAIANSYSHTCALVNSGMQCWGNNSSGQLGSGTVVSRSSPGPVLGLSSAVTFLSFGTNHTCALVNDGMQCWGLNNYGQLGDGTMDFHSSPVSVVGLASNLTANISDPVQNYSVNSFIPVPTRRPSDFVPEVVKTLSSVTTSFTGTKIPATKYATMTGEKS